MNRLMSFVFCLAWAPAALAENVRGVRGTICSTARAHVCVETEPCFASGQERATGIGRVQRGQGMLFLQGIANGRAISFVATEALSRPVSSLTEFGACASTGLGH